MLMACRYEYKNHRFDSIEQLDDFLITRYPYESKYGDAIFSTVIPMKTFDTLIEGAKKGYDIFERKQNLTRKRKNLVLDDDPYNASDYEYTKSFIGVTTAIPLMIGIGGNNLAPEVVLDNYFNKLKLDAANGNFSKTNGSNFSEEDVQAIFGVDNNGNPIQPQPIPESEFDDRVRKVLESKWKFQADIGNSIHDTLQAYFVGLGKEEGKSTPIRRMKDAKARREELKRIIRGVDGKDVYFTSAYFNNNNEKVLKSQPVDAVSKDALTDEMIDNLFDIAEGVYNDLLTRYGTDENGNENFELFAEYPVHDDQIVDTRHHGTDEIESNRRLSGSIDLMVVGKDGTPHLIDWKTSPKTYANYAEAKRRTYRYQLGLYRQILDRMGINTDNTDLYIAPVRITGIHKNDDGSWGIDGVGVDNNSNRLEDITGSTIGDPTIMENINFILKGRSTYIPKNEDVVEATNKEIKTILPEHGYGYENLSDEYIHDQFKKYCAINKATGKYNYYKNAEHKGVGRMIGDSLIETATPEEMYDKIRMYHISKPERRREQVDFINRALISELNNGIPIDIQIRKESKEYLDGILAKYRNGRWKVIEDIPAAKEFGLIFLRNIYTNRIDIINITNENLNDMHPTKKGTELISGYLHDDIIEKAKKSRMLTSIEGNLELVKTLSVINNLDGFFDRNNSYIGNIIAINVNDGESVHAHNEDLKYTYNTLMRAHKKDGVTVNRGINFGDQFDMIKDDLIELQSVLTKQEAEWGQLTDDERKSREKPNLLKKFKGVKAYEKGDSQALSSNLEISIKTNGEKRNALIRLQKAMESNFKFLNEIKPESDIDSSNRDIYEMYIDVSKAISELSGVQLKQQLFESNPWMQFGFTKILKRGYTSTYMDNPGMMYSDILNATTGYVGNAYQNIRDRLADPISKFTEIENRMIEAIGSNRVTMALKSREDIWREFYRKNEDGSINESFMFVDPETVADPTKKKILEDLLFEINKVRLMSDESIPSDEQVLSTKDSPKYYYVPIMKRGYTDSNGTTHNTADTLMTKLKMSLSNLVSAEFWSNLGPNIKEKTKELFAPSVDESMRAKKEANDLYQVNEGLLGEGDLDDRKRRIAEIGIDNISGNAINAGLSLAFSRISSFELDNALTLMKCSILNLKYEGDLMNRKYEKDIEYLQNYIRKNIKSQDINDPKLSGLSSVIDKLSNIAVNAVLAFSPIQALYQPLQGLFNNTTLVTKRVLGDKSFGFKEFEQGFKISYADIVDNRRSKLSILNQIFGINDMDMNDYVNKANDHKDIVTVSGLRKVMMVFASRPDYYNRMTIFTAQMIKDGTWDAYEKVGNELVYDFKKDKRFSRLHEPNPTKDAEYYKQLGEYTAMAKQFVVENARELHGPDKGKRFRYVEGEIRPLPKAYTNQQSEAYKNIADDIYGYYSHEKKAMVHALLLGKLFMQFKTYFSGKKNQYFMPGGVRMRGDYQHASDDEGHKLYSYTDNDGLESYASLQDNGKYINTSTGEEITSDTLVPFYAWKGQYQEGVAVTVARLLSEKAQGKTWKEALETYTENPDETVRNAFRTNMRQLTSDVVISLLVGAIIAGLLRKMYEDMRGDDEVPEIAKDAAYILSRAVTNAALDANIFNTVMGTTTDWNPLTITWTKKAASNILSVLSGDKSAFDALANSVSSVGQVKNTVGSLWQESKE